VTFVGSLDGFGMAQMLAIFHCVGNIPWLREMLESCRRDWCIIGPPLVISWLWMLSGPIALLFFNNLVACKISLVVIGAFRLVWSSGDFVSSWLMLVR